MKSFKHLKQLIKNTLDEKTYDNVDFNGKTFKEIVIDDDIIYDDEMDCSNHIDIDTCYLIINGNGHVIDFNHLPGNINISSEYVIIKNCKFKNGPSRIIYNIGALRIDNCTFTCGKPSYGSTIHNDGFLIVENSIFENKRGVTIFNGYALLVDNCVFKNNSSKYPEVTIMNSRSYKSRDNINSSEYWGITAEMPCTIKNSVFEDNTQVIETKSDLNVENCIFTNNKGVLNIVSSTINISGCLFENNEAYLIRNSSRLKTDVTLQNCDFINNHSEIITTRTYNKSRLFLINKSRLFLILNGKKLWNIKNCHFENNTSNYIFKCGFADINFENLSFENNDFESLLMLKKDYDETLNGKFKLNNVSFKEELEDVITCAGYLEINDCKFQKHHKINNESVLEMHKSEKRFLDKIN